MGVRIKGQGFIGFMGTLRQLHGDEPHARVLAALPPDLGGAIRNREILPMGWYSIAWYVEMHQAARAVCGEGVSRHVGREACRQDVTSIYRFILKFLSPEVFLQQSAKVFALFCEGGRCEVESATAGSARILYSECPGASSGMWDNVIGGTERLVELCGGREVFGKPLRGGGDGDPTLLAQITWKPR
jgi:hypothetical protein